MAADQDFIRSLYKSVRAQDFAAAGLPPPALEMLLDQQFRAQAAGYAAQCPDALHLVVLHRGEPVGRLILQTGADSWRIIDIVVLPSMSDQGIGTDVIAAVAHAAREAGAHALDLSVLTGNVAARRLYARLGFVESGGESHIALTKRLDR